MGIVSVPGVANNQIGKEHPPRKPLSYILLLSVLTLIYLITVLLNLKMTVYSEVMSGYNAIGCNGSVQE